jgi:UDP-N-acetylglucosamine:LPS N-acetylglucosamine transferase
MPGCSGRKKWVCKVSEERKKLLLVYDKYGHGHIERARLIRCILESNSDIEVEAVAASEWFGLGAAQQTIRLWNGLIRRGMFRTVDLVVNFLARLLLMPIMEVRQTGKALRKLHSFRPSMIVSTADSVNKALGQYAKQNQIPLFIVVTEFSVYMDLVNPNAVHLCYFEPTIAAIRRFDFSAPYFARELEEATPWFQRMRYVAAFWRTYFPWKLDNRLYRALSDTRSPVNRARCIAVGPLVAPRFFSKGSYDVARLTATPAKPPMVLVASGSLGGSFLVRLVRQIVRSVRPPISVVVLCGTDVTTRHRVERLAAKEGGVAITALGFISDVDTYIRCSDCVVSRPSAGIFTECMVLRTPFVTFHPTVSNDLGCLELIERYRLGVVCRHPSGVGQAINDVLQATGIYRDHIEAFLRPYPDSFDGVNERVCSAIFAEGAPAVTHVEGFRGEASWRIGPAVDTPHPSTTDSSATPGNS